MNKLNGFTWTKFGITIIQGILILASLPIILSTIVFILNYYYSI